MMPWGGMFCMEIAHYITLKMLYKEEKKSEAHPFFFLYYTLKLPGLLILASIY